MKFMIIAVAAVLVASPAFAASVKSSAPGHEMQRQGSVVGSPGASGYAPGHLKKKAGIRSASRFAPGHMTKKSAHVRVRATTGAAIR